MKFFLGLRKIIAFTTLATTAMAFTASGQWQVVKLLLSYANPISIAEFRLHSASEATYSEYILQAINEEDFDDARNLVALAEENGKKIPPDLREAANPGAMQTTLMVTRDFANGALTGEFNGAASMAGTMIADYLVIGDIRDIAIQGSRLLRGEDYDGLILGLATAGLVTLAPGTGGLDLGLSFLKTAKRTGRISKPLQKQIAHLTSDLIDTSALKRALTSSDLASGNVKLLRRNLSEAVRPKALSELEIIAENTADLVGAAGIKGGMGIMTHVDDMASDLPRFTRLARHMGDRTSAVVRMFGKSAIRLGDLVWHIVAGLLGLLGWLAGFLWMSFSLLRSVCRLFIPH